LKILFFAPHAAVWIHSFPEALVAEALKKEGHDIIYVSCGRQFKKYCIAMASHGLKHNAIEKQKNRICETCESNKALIKNSFTLTGYDLDEKLSQDDFVQITNTMSQVTKENFFEFQVDGIDVGKIALYQFLLINKKHELNFSDLEWRGYLFELENTLFSLYACRKILDEERPQRVVTYISLYSVNNVCFQLANRMNIPGYFLHAGGNLSRRLQTLYIGKDNPLIFIKRMVERWERFKEIPCTKVELGRVTDHFLELLKGKHFFAYSLPKSKEKIDLRKTFSVGDRQKIIVATLSSYDEIFSAQIFDPDIFKGNSIFESQVEWIKELLEFVKENDDLFLIIRVHPREFPNKREGLRSEHSILLEKEFFSLPPNAKVNWPDDKMSLFDLAEVADLFLNAWSSAGKEMAMLGIPVLLTWPHYAFYPSDLNYVAKNKDDYFLKVREALREGWSLKNIRKAYRWYVLEYERSVFDISESYRFKEGKESGFIARVIHYIEDKIFRRYLRKRECKLRAKKLESGHEIAKLIEAGKMINLDMNSVETAHSSSLENETYYLKEELKRIMRFLYPGDDGNISGDTLRKKLISLLDIKLN
jgi:hypothetical protein